MSGEFETLIQKIVDRRAAPKLLAVAIATAARAGCVITVNGARLDSSKVEFIDVATGENESDGNGRQ